MASQKHLAEMLNITQSTVSRALNDDKSLPVETILKVKKMAKQLGYKPRRYSRNSEELIMHNSDKLSQLLILINGKLANKSSDNLAIDILQGFTQSKKDNNIEVIIHKINTLNDAKKIANLYSNNSIGCVTIYRFDDDIIKFLSANFACLSINHQYDDLDIKTIDVDQELAFADMYKYLFDKGHRNIGFLTIKNSNNLIFNRLAGYYRGAKLTSNTINNNWIFNETYHNQLDTVELVDKIIKLYKEEKVTAFICTSGGFAEVIISKLLKKNIKVPEDISFAAFDELFTTFDSGISLFGGQTDYREISNCAINVLKNFEQFGKISHISIPAIFYYGNSVKNLNI